MTGRSPMIAPSSRSASAQSSANTSPGVVMIFSVAAERPAILLNRFVERSQPLLGRETRAAAHGRVHTGDVGTKVGERVVAVLRAHLFQDREMHEPSERWFARSPVFIECGCDRHARRKPDLRGVARGPLHRLGWSAAGSKLAEVVPGE